MTFVAVQESDVEGAQGSSDVTLQGVLLTKFQTEPARPSGGRADAKQQFDVTMFVVCKSEEVLHGFFFLVAFLS